MRDENVPLTELLASHGYVVVSVDYLLTNLRAPGWPNARDVVNSFFESRFATDPAERAFHETFLRETLARDFPEVRYEGTVASPSTAGRGGA